MLKVSVKGSSQLPFLHTAGTSSECLAQHQHSMGHQICSRLKVLACITSFVSEQWSTECTGISLGCGQRGPDHSLIYKQDKDSTLQACGRTFSFPFSYYTLKIFAENRFNCLKQTPKTESLHCHFPPKFGNWNNMESLGFLLLRGSSLQEKGIVSV